MRKSKTPWSSGALELLIALKDAGKSHRDVIEAINQRFQVSLTAARISQVWNKIKKERANANPSH